MDLHSVRVLSVCSGTGAGFLGVRLAVPNARLVCAVEIEAYACELLATRMDQAALDAAPIWTDLRTFDGIPWRGSVDLITGGYPCQPFSKAGARLGADDPRNVWPDLKRVIGEIEPPAVFFENVREHISLGLDVVYRDLRDLGYRVEAGIFSAEEVGAPHRRERLFILGVSDSESARLQRGRLGIETWGREPVALRANGGEIPQWPPDLADQAEWNRILTIRPELAPALVTTPDQSNLRRLADGMASRVDRLRAGGNGVVPLQAAYALVTLARRIGAKVTPSELTLEIPSAR